MRGMGWATLVMIPSCTESQWQGKEYRTHPQLEGTADVLVRPSNFGLGLRTWGKAAQKPTKEYHYNQQWI